jgi:phosphatidate cytidylyltransferase
MTRILSAIVLIPVALLVVVFAAPRFYLAGIGIVGTICLYEYCRIMRAMNIRPRTWFVYFMFWALLVAFYLDMFPPIALLALALVVAFISSLWRKTLAVRERTFGLMAELFGVFYIALCLYPALLIRYDFGKSVGLHWTLVMLLAIWGGDTFALIAGKKIGKRPFAPILSPNKTQEGALAGFLAGIGIAVALQHFFFQDLDLRCVVAASILLGVCGQLGDLAESMIKRTAGVKDSSHLIPGHGGVLDRMDSLLLSIPVLYGFLLFIYP